jgi:hypothetical protein
MHVRRRRSTLVVLTLVLGTALVLSASSPGGTGKAKAPRAAGGFGEIYKANPKTLAKTLFSACLLYHLTLPTTSRV